MANYDKQFNVNKGLSVKGTTVIDENRNVNAVALTVSSTAVVTNLNAEKVGGKTLELLGVADANSTISGAWNFTGTPSFTVASDIAPFTVSANSATVTNLSAGKFAGLTTDGFALIGSTRSITGTWSFQTGPSFTATSPTAPFAVTSNVKVANLNADLLDGYDSAAAATASTIALRDSNGNISANQFIMSVASAGTRSADTVFYSSTTDTIYKNTVLGMKASLGFLNVADLAAWTGSSNITTLGTATTTGTLTASRFISNVATGTAPFTVASTTMVSGLNAQYIGGIDATNFVSTGYTVYIGSTAVPLNRVSGLLALTGVTLNAADAITTGTLPVARGGTGLTTFGTAGYILATNSNADALEWVAKPTSLTIGTTSITAAAGDHLHAGVYMPATPAYITVTNGMRLNNWGVTSNEGYGFYAPLSTTMWGKVTVSSGSATSDLLLMTGGSIKARDLTNAAYRPLYAGNIYSNGAQVSVTGHSHLEFLSSTGGTVSGTLTCGQNLNVATNLWVGSTASFSNNVTIGSTSVNRDLYVYGTAHYIAPSGDLSDIRLKRDIRSIDSKIALAQISEISNKNGIIGYRMKTDSENAKEIFGISAQVIAEVVPQASGNWDLYDDGTEYLTWIPNAITALLISAVARLNERLTNLEVQLGVTP